MAAPPISEQPTKPETAINKLGLGARAYSRVLKVGRTIAEAIQYRSLDRRL